MLRLLSVSILSLAWPELRVIWRQQVKHKIIPSQGCGSLWNEAGGKTPLSSLVHDIPQGKPENQRLTLSVQEPWRGDGIPRDRGAASAAGEQEGSTAALGHGARQQGTHLSSGIPRESVYITPHPHGQELPAPAQQNPGQRHFKPICEPLILSP